MTDEDKCGRAAEIFYQQINERKKKDPNFEIPDMASAAHEFAMMCGFDHPRCFIKYIEDIENEKANST